MISRRKLKLLSIWTLACGLMFIKPFCHTFAESVYTEFMTSLTPSQQEDLKEGKIILYITTGTGNQNTMVKAALLFECTPEAAWNSLSDPLFHKEYLDALKKITEIRKDGNRSWVRIFMQWLLIKQNFQIINTFNSADYFYEWELDPAYPNDISDYTGYWQLYAYPGNRTLGEYNTSMSLAGLPEWLENLIRKEIVKYSLNHLKKYLDDLPASPG